VVWCVSGKAHQLLVNTARADAASSRSAGCSASICCTKAQRLGVRYGPGTVFQNLEERRTRRGELAAQEDGVRHGFAAHHLFWSWC
jgi:hypothetical protein